MTKNKMFSIITIACFISILFIPIGLVLMFFYTDWSKKIKITVATILSLLYLLLSIFLINLSPNDYQNGFKIPFNIKNGTSEVSSNKSQQKNTYDFETEDLKELNEFSEIENSEDTNQMRLPKSVSKKRSIVNSRYFYTILFMLFMMFLIIHQNLKASKKKEGYENPYVDTKKYKLPLQQDFEFPMVHFLKIKIANNEKILFATETTKKEEEGDFVVTNKRIVVLSKSGDYEFPLPALTAVSSVSNSVMLLTCGDRKYYIFFPENQLKYALAVVRWAYSNQ